MLRSTQLHISNKLQRHGLSQRCKLGSQLFSTTSKQDKLGKVDDWEADYANQLTQLQTVLLRDNVLTSKLTRTRSKLQKILNDGPQNLMVVADFDYTLSKPGALSSWSIITGSPRLGPHFKENATALARKFYPFEVDLSMTVKDRSPKLTEWFLLFHQSILDEKLNKETFFEAVHHGYIYTPEKYTKPDPAVSDALKDLSNQAMDSMHVLQSHHHSILQKLEGLPVSYDLLQQQLKDGYNSVIKSVYTQKSSSEPNQLDHFDQLEPLDHLDQGVTSDSNSNASNPNTTTVNDIDQLTTFHSRQRYLGPSNVLEMRTGFHRFVTEIQQRKVPFVVVSAGIGNVIEDTMHKFGFENTFLLGLQKKPLSSSQTEELVNKDTIFLVANFIVFDNQTQDGVEEDSISMASKGPRMVPEDPIHVFNKSKVAELAVLQQSLIENRDSLRQSKANTNTNSSQSSSVRTPQSDQELEGDEYFQKYGASMNHMDPNGLNVILLGDSLGDITIAASLPHSAEVLTVGFLNPPVNVPVEALIGPSILDISSLHTCPEKSIHGEVDSQEADAVAKDIGMPAAIAQYEKANCRGCAVQLYRERLLEHLRAYDIVILGDASLGFPLEILQSL